MDGVQPQALPTAHGLPTASRASHGGATTVPPSSWCHQALTGHLVMSSGHTWGGLDAGSSHVLVGRERWGSGWIPQHIPPYRLVPPQAQTALGWGGSCTSVSYNTPQQHLPWVNPPAPSMPPRSITHPSKQGLAQDNGISHCSLHLGQASPHFPH